MRSAIHETDITDVGWTAHTSAASTAGVRRRRSARSSASTAAEFAACSSSETAWCPETRAPKSRVSSQWNVNVSG